jgi:hypothetical protein
MRKSILKVLKLFGYGLLVLVIVFFALVLYSIKKIGFPQQDCEVLLIKNISIIDLKNDRVYRNQNIKLRGKIIESISIGSADVENVEANRTKIIDGTDSYLIPALWDMHVHLTKQSPYVAYPAFIQNGITHVRDMRGAHKERDPFAGVQSNLEQWNNEVNNYTLLGPRLHGFTSFAIDGPNAIYNGLPTFFNCATSEDASKLVTYLKQKKVTLIKVYNNIPREAFFTLMREAKKAHIDVAGHKPVRVSTIEASDAGMKSIEHARFFIWDSYSGSDNLRQRENPNSTVNTALRYQMLQQFDTVILQENFNALKRNNTWYCPTHLTRRDEAFADDKYFRARYDHINPLLRFLSFEDLDATIQEDTSALGRKVFMDFYIKGLEITGKASKQEIKILAGSDVPELPGSSLHEELVELSKAGLTPFEVLRTATLYPALYYGLENVYGSIEKGKRADMIILSANPVEDINNTKAIKAVIFDGKYIDETVIKGLKESVEKNGRSIVMSAKLLWDMLIYITL